MASKREARILNHLRVSFQWASKSWMNFYRQNLFSQAPRGRQVDTLILRKPFTKKSRFIKKKCLWAKVHYGRALKIVGEVFFWTVVWIWSIKKIIFWDCSVKDTPEIGYKDSAHRSPEMLPSDLGLKIFTNPLNAKSKSLLSGSS